MRIIRPVTMLLTALALFTAFVTTTLAGTGSAESFCKAHAEEIRKVHSYKHKFGMSKDEAKSKYAEDSPYQGHIDLAFMSGYVYEKKNVDTYLDSLHAATLKTCLDRFKRRRSTG